MKFFESSKNFSLNKSTYINLRWIAYSGQLGAIIIVQFLLNFKFNYILCLLIVLLGILTNFYLRIKIRDNQLENSIASKFLLYDILQLGFLFYLTGGITNPFLVLIIIPSVFSAQYLKISSSILLVSTTSVILMFLTFFYQDLPHPKELHFHAPNYYLYSIPVSILIGLVFLVYFGTKFGSESRIRKEAYEKIQELMAKENELLSLGGQAAAAAHSLGTPLSTILLTTKELQKEFRSDNKIKKDLDLLASQAERCREILKKLSLNPNYEDEFIDSNITLEVCVLEIVRSYEEISKKKFLINLDNFKNPIKFYKSSEIIYGLRNFIGNANKFSKGKVEIFLISDKKESTIIVTDDGPGFPKELIDKNRLGEPYIRTADEKHGLGLGTFIGKTLLEKNFAKVSFRNLEKNSGAEIIINWKNKDLSNI